MNKTMKRNGIGWPLPICFLFLLLLAGCGGESRWNGTYTGEVMETAQITVTQANGATNAFTGSRSQADVAVTLVEDGGEAAILTFGDCRLSLQLEDETHATVAEGQGCDINANGYSGRVLFTGQVYFDGNEKLTMQLAGLPDRPGATGGYSYVFTQP
jgi:hypothetical protein